MNSARVSNVESLNARRPLSALHRVQRRDDREARLEGALYAFALACVSVGLVMGIGLCNALGAR